MKHFIFWQLQHMTAAQRQQKQQQKQHLAAASNDRSGTASLAAAATARQQQQQQRQQFQQLLGPHLQLLNPDQAAALQRRLIMASQNNLGVSDSHKHANNGDQASDSSSDVMGPWQVPGASSSIVIGLVYPSIASFSPWDTVEVALLESLVAAARAASAPAEAWEAAAALLR